MRRLLGRLLGRRAPGTGDFEVLLDGNQGAPNVLVLTEYINATYFISFDIPLRPLHAQGQINLAVASQKHVVAQGDACWERWADSFRPDVVILTRYGDPTGRAILDFFRRRGVPVVYHIDDDLLEVPDSLGAEIRKRQRAGSVVETRRYLFAHCDLIYASTEHLASVLEQRFPGQKVFHGMYAPYLGDVLPPAGPAVAGRAVIGYMGSKGHQQDLEMVVPTLERLLDERPGLEFEVFGTIKLPGRLERFGHRARSHVVQKSYTEFLGRLTELHWSVGLAPLEDAPFNRCKAPTKFIEYTACGIPVVASQVPLYQDAMPENGGRLVVQDWYTPIVEFLDDPHKAGNAVATARRHCASLYSVQRLQTQLLHVLETVQLLEQP